MSYQINTPYWSNNPPDGQGVRLSWTWPPPDFVGAADPLLAVLYIQRSTSTNPTINTHWPLSPNFIDDVGSQFTPTPETGWETIKTINVPPQFMTNTAPTDPTNLAQWLLARSYIDPIPQPTTNTYYRIVGFAQVDVGPDRFFEWDWAPAPYTPTIGGSSIYTKTFGGTSNEAGSAIATDSGGNFYVFGYFSGTTNIGGIVLTALGAQDWLLAKYTPAGVPVWVKQFGVSGGNFIIPSKIRLDGAGNIYVAGSFNGLTNMGGANFTSRGSSAYPDGCLAKYTSAGIHVWSLQIGSEYFGPKTDTVKALGVSSAGDVYVGGISSTGFTIDNATVPQTGAEVAYVAKFNTSGVGQWARTYNDAHPFLSSAGVVSEIVVDSSGNILVAGSSGTSTLQFNSEVFTVSSSALVLVKWNSSGVVQWAKLYNNTNTNIKSKVDSTAQAATLDANDNFIVASGIYAKPADNATIDVGPGPVVSSGNNDVFVGRYSGNDGSYLAGYQIRGSGVVGSAMKPKGIVVDAIGNVVLCGNMVGYATVGQVVLSNLTALQDAFCAKLNSALQPTLWANLVGGSQSLPSDFNSLCVSSDASAVITLTGYVYGPGNYGGRSFTHVGGTDMTLFQVNP